MTHRVTNRREWTGVAPWVVRCSLQEVWNALDQEVSVFEICEQEIHLVLGADGDGTRQNTAAVCLFHNGHLRSRGCSVKIIVIQGKKCVWNTILSCLVLAWFTYFTQHRTLFWVHYISQIINKQHDLASLIVNAHDAGCRGPPELLIVDSENWPGFFNNLFTSLRGMMSWHRSSSLLLKQM